MRALTSHIFPSNFILMAQNTVCYAAQTCKSLQHTCLFICKSLGSPLIPKIIPVISDRCENSLCCFVFSSLQCKSSMSKSFNFSSGCHRENALCARKLDNQNSEQIDKQTVTVHFFMLQIMLLLTTTTAIKLSYSYLECHVVTVQPWGFPALNTAI